MTLEDRKFLFEYTHKGLVYGFSIYANDIKDARDKMDALRRTAEYRGEVFAEVRLTWLDRLKGLFR